MHDVVHVVCLTGQKYVMCQESVARDEKTCGGRDATHAVQGGPIGKIDDVRVTNCVQRTVFEFWHDQGPRATGHQQQQEIVVWCPVSQVISTWCVQYVSVTGVRCAS